MKYVKVQNPLISSLTQLALFSRDYGWTVTTKRKIISRTEYKCICFDNKENPKEIKYSDKDIPRAYIGDTETQITFIEAIHRKTLDDVEPYVWVDWDSKNNPNYKISKSQDNKVFVSCFNISNNYISSCRPDEFFVKE